MSAEIEARRRERIAFLQQLSPLPQSAALLEKDVKEAAKPANKKRVKKNEEEPANLRKSRRGEACPRLNFALTSSCFEFEYIIL